MCLTAEVSSFIAVKLFLRSGNTGNTSSMRFVLEETSCVASLTFASNDVMKFAILSKLLLMWSNFDPNTLFLACLKW